MDVDRGDLETYRVSVIMSTNSRANEIRKAINSVIEQTFSNFELVVVDDGSAADTAAVVGSFADPRIKYVSRESPGVTGSRNHGLTVATGNVIAFLDAGNSWGKHYLELSVAQLHSAQR